MKYNLSEKRVLRKLDIPDFRHMSKDKIVQFASLLPNMDPEVAKKALEQFPEFKDMTIEVVNQLRIIMEKSVDSNDRSQDAFFSACNEVISILNEELKKDNLTSEDENRIRESIIRVLGMMKEKDTENKKFLLGLAKTAGATACTLLLTSAVVLGAGGKLPLKSFRK